MQTREELIQKLDDELHRFVRPPSEVPAGGSYFEQLHVMAAVRNEFETIPLYDLQLEMLINKENILQSAYEHWQSLDTLRCSFDKDNFCEVTYDFLTKEDYRYRDTLLYDRASGEYQNFLDGLKQKTPQQIIDSAYEITIKYDILSLLEEHNMKQQQIDVLLTLETPLDGIYHEWLEDDYSYMDMLRDSMDSLIKDQTKELLHHSYDHNGQIPEKLKNYYEVYEWEDETVAAEERSEDLEP